MPTIVLPYQFDGSTIGVLAQAVADQSKGGWPPEICVDFSRLNFVRPAGVVFLSNLVSWLHNQNTRVLFQNIHLETSALAYLDDAMFFEQHCGAKQRAHAVPRATTRPLQRIAHAQSHDWLRNQLMPWLAGRLSVNTASLGPFQNCLAELFNNIQDHTVFDIGTIFAQHFPRENRVYVTLSDFGGGIPATVRQAEPQLSDYQAIVRATAYGFSTKPTPRNQGIGLDYLLGEVVNRNGGSVTFCSGNSIVRFEKDTAGRISNQELWSNGFSPGTTIDIVFRTDRIVRLPETQEDLVW